MNLMKINDNLIPIVDTQLRPTTSSPGIIDHSHNISLLIFTYQYEENEPLSLILKSDQDIITMVKTTIELPLDNFNREENSKLGLNLETLQDNVKDDLGKPIVVELLVKNRSS